MENLKKLRKASGLTQKQLGELVGISEAQVSLIENGNRNPSFETALKIAEALDCEYADLITTKRTNRPNIAVSYATFQIIGEVAAGYGHFTDGLYDDEIDIPMTWLKGKSQSDYFVLRVSGDSMYPQYQDGDIVLVLKQSTMDHSGQIGVVTYNDDMATLKRVEYVSGEWMKLSPINPQFPPMTIQGEALNHCNILGVPTMLIRSIK